jgi:hypothetical protein
VDGAEARLHLGYLGLVFARNAAEDIHFAATLDELACELDDVDIQPAGLVAAGAGEGRCMGTDDGDAQSRHAGRLTTSR